MENIMNGVLVWIKQIFAVSILSGLLLHIVPAEKYQRYVKFICSILLTVICINPLIGLFYKDVSYRDFYNVFKQYGDMEELRRRIDFEPENNKGLIKEYETAVITYVEFRALNSGLNPSDTKVVIDWDEDSQDYGKVQKIDLKVAKAMGYSGNAGNLVQAGEGSNKNAADMAKVKTTLKKELAEYYDINISNVNIY